MACTVCGHPCALVYYQSREEAQANMSPRSVCLAVPWGPGYRSLYCHIADDVDFCGPGCSTRYYADQLVID